MGLFKATVFVVVRALHRTRTERVREHERELGKQVSLYGVVGAPVSSA